MAQLTASTALCAKESPSSALKYHYLITQEEVEAAARQLAQSHVVACDLETSGLDPLTCEILLWAFKGEETPVYLLHGSLDHSPLLEALQDKVFLAHNAVFEYQFIKSDWRTWDTHEPERWYCTQVAESILTAGLREEGESGEKRASLAEVVKKYCGVVLNKDQQTTFVGETRGTFHPTNAQLEYAARDVVYLHDVMHAQLARLGSEALLRVARLEFSFLPALGDMMLNGFKLDIAAHHVVLIPFLEEVSRLHAEVLATMTPLWGKVWAQKARIEGGLYDAADKALTQYMEAQGIKRLAKDTPEEVRLRVQTLRKERDKHKLPKECPEFNLGSSDQMLSALTVVGIKLIKTEKGETKPSMDKNVVKEWLDKNAGHTSAPVLRLYAQYAKAAKVVSTYGDTLVAKVHPATGRVHANYNQMVNSGRLSSSNPNQQNMPPQIRACFVPEEGNVLVVADAKNQEGRIAAALSKDANLLDVFLTGKDWHCMTAALAYPEKFADWTKVPKDSPERAGCKNANFSSIYGGSAYTLYSRGYVTSLAIGERLMDAVGAFAPTLVKWSAQVAEDAVTKGWVATISGRKRYFSLPPQPTGRDELVEWRKARGSIRRAAMNHPVQGSGADVMKQAMVILRKPLAALGYKLVATVHDEIVYEGPEEYATDAAALVGEKMEEAAGYFIRNLPVPADVHVVTRWEK